MEFGVDVSEDLSVISEEEEIYNGKGSWIISLLDMENKNSISSKEFYVGNANYCRFSMHLMYKKSSDIIKFESLILRFVEKLPEGAMFTGEITFVDEHGEVFDYQKFISRENIADWNFTSTEQCFPVTEDLNRFAENGNLRLEWNLKMKIGFMNWESGSKNFKLKKRYEEEQKEGFRNLKEKLYEDKLFTDVTFRIHGGETDAHRSILMLEVPRLEMLFNTYPTDNYFKFKDIDKQPLDKLFEFVYSRGILQLDFTLASLLLIGANTYKVFALKHISCSYLGANLTEKNVFIAIALAARCEDIALKEHCIEFIKKCNTKSLVRESFHIAK